MSTLLLVEMRRALARRLVRVLMLLACVAALVTGIVVFVNADPLDRERFGGHGVPSDVVGCYLEQAERLERAMRDDVPAFTGPAPLSECEYTGDTEPVDPEDPRYLIALWPGSEFGTPDGLLLPAATFLILGGLVAGASTLGAEWRAGTIGTLLTWDPRRVHVLAAKLAAAGVLAFVIAVALLEVWSLVFLPTVLLKGSTMGADLDWWLGTTAAVLRIGAVTGAAAVLGASLASIGRNTGAALGTMFGWVAVVEPLVRGLRPRWQPWLVAENIGRFVTAEPLGGVADRGTVGAGVTVFLYVAVASGVAFTLFQRRDVAATS
jgi:hypothetical protein